MFTRRYLLSSAMGEELLFVATIHIGHHDSFAAAMCKSMK